VKGLLHGGHGAESLLVAMAVQERAFFGEGPERQGEALGLVLARDELSNSSALAASASVSPPGSIDLNSSRMPRMHEAPGRRRDAAPHVGLERVQDPSRLGLRLADHARREEGAPAAQGREPSAARATCTP